MDPEDLFEEIETRPEWVLIYDASAAKPFFARFLEHDPEFVVSSVGGAS
jgi:hypothetical protein